jgi:hypothetical protein
MISANFLLALHLALQASQLIDYGLLVIHANRLLVAWLPYKPTKPTKSIDC